MKPFLLRPVTKDYIWGGTRLREEFGKESDSERIAESWELSCHPDGECIIASGEYSGMKLSEFVRLYPAAVGKNFRSKDRFPVLVKLIDAKSDLSIQCLPQRVPRYTPAGFSRLLTTAVSQIGEWQKNVVGHGFVIHGQHALHLDEHSAVQRHTIRIYLDDRGTDVMGLGDGLQSSLVRQSRLPGCARLGSRNAASCIARVEAPRERPAVLVADLDLGQRDDALTFGLMYTRRPDRYGRLHATSELGRQL